MKTYLCERECYNGVPTSKRDSAYNGVPTSKKGVPTLSSYISETTAYTMECLHLREGVPTFAYNAKRLPRCSPALLQGVLWGSHHLSMWQEELCQEVTFLQERFRSPRHMLPRKHRGAWSKT